jgi:hypothetical protein
MTQVEFFVRYTKPSRNAHMTSYLRFRSECVKRLGDSGYSNVKGLGPLLSIPRLHNIIQPTLFKLERGMVYREVRL